MSPDTGLGLAAVVVLPLLIVIGVAASRYAGTRHDKGIVTAALRAVVQLAAVGAVVGVALQHTLGAIAFVLVMFVIATFTSTRRLHQTAVIPQQWMYCGTAIGLGAFVVLLLLIGPGVVPRNPATILPMGGIIIGGTMTATTLAGRRMLSEYGTRFGEFEAGLSIGLLLRTRSSWWSARWPATRCCPHSTRPERWAWCRCPGPSSGWCSAARRPPRPPHCSSWSCSA